MIRRLLETLFPWWNFSELCPICGETHIKVIYMGLPMKLCGNEECSCLWGFWSWIPSVFGFNGMFMTYSGKGRFLYLKALIIWLWPIRERKD